MRIRDIDSFYRDVEIVFTNAAYLGLVGLDVSADVENTLHEYAHFVTLKMRCPKNSLHDPRIYSRVGAKLDRWPKAKQCMNEVRTLAVELLVLRAAEAVHPLREGIFLKSIANANPDIPHLKRRVFRLLREDWEALDKEARTVVRRIRQHARARRKKSWISTLTPKQREALALEVKNVLSR